MKEKQVRGETPRRQKQQAQPEETKIPCRQNRKEPMKRPRKTNEAGKRRRGRITGGWFKNYTKRKRKRTKTRNI